MVPLKRGKIVSSSSRLRYVIIGVGAGVLHMHLPALELETVELVAVSDVNVELGQQRANELKCAFYADHRTMLAEMQPDVAVIITPHTFHAPIAIDCFEAGCHVLVEKPIAVEVAEADAMIEAADEANRLLAVNFQQRYRPEVRAAYKLIQEGQLGAIQHVDMTVVWTRTARYFQHSAWRGTWKGEGGGVLLNQAPHNLDLICHLIGMPSRLVAWTRNLLHPIETEDTVQAMLEWRNDLLSHGTLGSLHISTAESGVPERLELVGTNGRLQVQRGKLIFEQFEQDLRDYVVQTANMYEGPPSHPVSIEPEPGAGDHIAIYRNLQEAIWHGTPLIADGRQARMSLELANAMTYSSYTKQQIELPLDRDAYAALLEQLRKQ